LNVIIHGRSASKLEGLSKEITERFPTVQVKIIVQDVMDNPNWDQMAESIQGLDISVLVNNVGGGSLDGGFNKMHERSMTYHQQLHNLNFGAAIGWTSLVLPKMVEKQKGRILSSSSLAYLFGYGGSVYGADKGAINSFTLNLNNEYIEHGIRAESLIIGLVSTPAVPTPPDFFGYVLSSDLIAENALNLFGWKEIYAPGFAHSFFHLVGTLLPTRARAKAARDGTEEVMSIAQKGREAINKKEL
jgi:17beta-estradiol 17-dehydrogenase / very-long-chain 3-oxoacyl-CoA reductase